MKTASFRHPCSAITPLETIAGYPSILRIFKIGCSPFWYARVFVNGKYRKISLKTVSKSEAIHYAKQFFLKQFDIYGQVAEQLTGHIFDSVAQSLMVADERKVRRGERSVSLLANNQYAYVKHVKPALGQMNIKVINYAVLEKFANELEDRNLSPSSIRCYLSFVGKVLKHAHKLDLINRLPQVPRIKVKDGIRGWFSATEYQRLLHGIELAIQEKMAVRQAPILPDIQFLVELMVETMLRPSDMKLLRHKHVEIIQSKHSYLRITTDFSKTINSPVISTAEGVAIYQNLRAYQEKLNCAAKEDYLIYPQHINRQSAASLMRRQFAAILDRMNLRQSPQGEPRTLYSLRHSAIMFALLKKDSNLLKIARNARTSPDMVDRFYARHLTAEMDLS